MLLEFYRENRTAATSAFFHLGTSYGVSESNAQRNIIKIEDILIQSGYFKLTGKKVLLFDKNIKTILVDVTETPVPRPKKSRNKYKVRRSSKQKLLNIVAKNIRIKFK